MDKPKLPKSLQNVVEAVEHAGGKVQSIRPYPYEEVEPDGYEIEVEAASLTTREMIREGIAGFELTLADTDAGLEERFGEDQNLYSRRSTSCILVLLLRDQAASAFATDGYLEAAAKDPGLVDVPTPEELARFQAAIGVGQIGYACEVGVFAGALLGRGGFTNHEVLRLMDESTFTFKLLTLRYRPEEICNLGRETLERLDQKLESSN